MTKKQKNTGKSPSQRTLCFLIKENQVLLAKKKKGFGEGKWLGIGGKVEANETVEEAMIRESQEEIGVTPTSYKQVAVLNFQFPCKPDWSQQVAVFLTDEWEGEPEESEEMLPKWLTPEEIPYDSMWSDAIHWLPKVLEGLTFKADFIFNPDNKTLKEVKFMKSFGNKNRNIVK